MYNFNIIKLEKFIILKNVKKLTLLSATDEMVKKYAKTPIITMSMAGLGIISRLAGETFGSALTFGTAEVASALGQVAIEELYKGLIFFMEVNKNFKII